MLLRYVIAISLVLAVIMISGCGDRAESKPESKIPEEIYQVIFEKSNFSIPITLGLPDEPSAKHIEGLKSRNHQLSVSVPRNLYAISEPLREVLLKHGYINEEELFLTYRGITRREVVLRYSDKTKPYFYERGDTFPRTELRLASRVLKSIDYLNQYTQPATAFHPDLDSIAVRFSYTLKMDFPHYEEVAEAGARVRAISTPVKEIKLDRVYTGEAKAYQDPGFRTWHLEDITLEDRELR